MLDTVKNLLKEVDSFTPKSKEELESFRLAYLGKKGKLNDLFSAFKYVPNEQKKEFGLANRTVWDEKAGVSVLASNNAKYQLRLITLAPLMKSISSSTVS